MKTNIISIKYEDNSVLRSFGGKPYYYYTAVDVEVGDLVMAPTTSGEKVARVSEINIPYDKILFFAQKLKLITDKIDKNLYLQKCKIAKAA